MTLYIVYDIKLLKSILRGTMLYFERLLYRMRENRNAKKNNAYAYQTSLSAVKNTQNAKRGIDKSKKSIPVITIQRGFCL